MTAPRRVAAATARVALLLISALMVWEAFSAGTFVMFFKRPVRDYLELSYIAAIVGSVVFCVHAALELVRKKRPIGTSILRLLLMLAWCFSLAVSCLLMAIRTGI